MKSVTASSWGRKGFCKQHRAPQLQSGSVCVYLSAHAPCPSARGHPASTCTSEIPEQQTEASNLPRHFLQLKSLHLTLPIPVKVSVLQKQRYPLQPEWQSWEGAQAGLSQQGGTGQWSGGSEAHSCHLHVLGKELQAQLRAQGQTKTLCWHAVVRKAGSARSAQSNR